MRLLQKSEQRVTPVAATWIQYACGDCPITEVGYEAKSPSRETAQRVCPVTKTWLKAGATMLDAVSMQITSLSRRPYSSSRF